MVPHVLNSKRTKATRSKCSPNFINTFFHVGKYLPDGMPSNFGSVLDLARFDEPSSLTSATANRFFDILKIYFNAKL